MLKQISSNYLTSKQKVGNQKLSGNIRLMVKGGMLNKPMRNYISLQTIYEVYSIFRRLKYCLYCIKLLYKSI